jgi:hypothetical protein
MRRQVQTLRRGNLDIEMALEEAFARRLSKYGGGFG